MATGFLLISWKQELQSTVAYEISHYRGTTVCRLPYNMWLQKSTPLRKRSNSVQEKRIPSSEPNITFGRLTSSSIVHTYISSVLL
jgi:hypothetical protein